MNKLLTHDHWFYAGDRWELIDGPNTLEAEDCTDESRGFKYSVRIEKGQNARLECVTYEKWGFKTMKHAQKAAERRYVKEGGW